MGTAYYALHEEFRNVRVRRGKEMVSIDVDTSDDRGFSVRVTTDSQAGCDEVSCIIGSLFNENAPVYQSNWMSDARKMRQLLPCRGEVLLSDEGEIVSRESLDLMVRETDWVPVPPDLALRYAGFR